MSGSIAAELGASGTILQDLSGTARQPELEVQIAALIKERDEWRNRFTGQQGAYSREQGKWQADAVKVNDLSSQIAGLVTDRDTQKNLAESVSGSVSLLQSELEIVTLQLERTQIIIKDFPELLSFEADGLLPDGTGDEFKAKLTKFKERLANNGKDAAKTAMLGGSPIPPGSTAPKTAADLRSLAFKALAEGKTNEYNQYIDELQKVAG